MAEERNDGLCKQHSGLKQCVIDLDKRVTGELISLEKSINIAKETLEHRLQGMNEFRKQLDNQSRTFVTRDYLIGWEKKVHDLELAKSNLDGRMWMLAGIFAVIQFVIGIFAVWVRLGK